MYTPVVVDIAVVVAILVDEDGNVVAVLEDVGGATDMPISEIVGVVSVVVLNGKIALENALEILATAGVFFRK